ncbi:MAG: hypothetical protein M3P40_08905 [Actinomycetota bacterium]|nr:hypothetical protein [Actinomycetota bacterium]
MRMRQSLNQLEEAFVEEFFEDRERRQQLQRHVDARSRRREIERTQKQGSIRFFLLLLALLATAVIVTVAMFETLYYVMG